MLVTHIYFNEQCQQAIELYKEAFGAIVKTLIEDSNDSRVVHTEIVIHNELLILNDFGNNDGVFVSGGYQFSVQFDNEAALFKAYDTLEKDSITIEPMQSTDYSPCVVRFIDMFDVT